MLPTAFSVDTKCIVVYWIDQLGVILCVMYFSEKLSLRLIY